MGFLKGFFGGHKKTTASKSTKPGPLPPGGKGLWSAWLDEYLGTAGTAGLSGTVSFSDKSGTSHQLLLNPDGTVTEGNTPVGSYAKSNEGYKITLTDGTTLYYNSSARTVDVMHDDHAAFPATWAPANPSGEGQGGNQSIMSSSPYAASLAGQQKWLDSQHQNYVNSINENVKPYTAAISRAEAHPINITWGGKPVGNIMMQGGINAEKKRLAANLLAPTEQWQYEQKNTPYTAYLNYINDLGNKALSAEKLAYGIPEESATAIGPKVSGMGKIGKGMQIGGSLGYLIGLL